MEYLNLLTTPKGAFVCVSLACASLVAVLAPVKAPERRAGSLFARVVDALSGGIAVSFGFLAVGQWCLPDGTRLFESAAALGLVGAVLICRWRKRLEALAGDTDALERANRKLKTASWLMLPVSVALVTYTSLFL